MNWLWSLGMWVHLGALCCSSAVANISSPVLDILQANNPAGIIYFNNPKLLSDKRAVLLAKDGLKASVAVAVKQSAADVDSLGGIFIAQEAQSLASHFRKLVNEELGVPTMQATFDAHSFTSSYLDTEYQVQEMVLQLEKKMNRYFEILNINKRHVEELYRHHFRMVSLSHCCLLDDEMLKYSEHFGTKVSFDVSCDTFPPNVEFGLFGPGLNLTTFFEENYKSRSTIKWQYFMSTDGFHTEYPAHSFDGKAACASGDDSRHQDIYLSTTQQKRKIVTIILDHSNALSNRQLEIGKSIAKHILSFLSYKDKVALIGLSSKIQYLRNDDCFSGKMVAATYEAKFHFTRFVDGLTKSKEPSNHTLGISKGFETIRNTLDEVNSSDMVPMIIYISRGLLNSLTEAKSVLSLIAEENEKLNFSVILNTFAVIDDHKPIMYEKEFLSDIAKQNFGNYKIQMDKEKLIKRGMMIPVNTTKHLDFVIRDSFTSMNISPDKEIVISLPYWDSVGKSTVVSISRSCFHQGHLIGMVGIDIHLAEVVEDMMYFSIPQKIRAFVVDPEGNTITHPLFSRPLFSSEQPMNTDISYLEDQPGFELIKENILKFESGKEQLTSEDTDYLDNISTSISRPKSTVYTWRRVPGMPYILCLVAQVDPNQIQMLKQASLPPYSEVTYHRFDLLPAPNMCQHLKQLASVDRSGLYLSPSSFQSPFQYLSQHETKRNVQSYMAYLTDRTKLIANPGLKNFVRNDVAVLDRITSKWKEKFQNSDISKYIIRRYITTTSGTFLLHPGAVMDRLYDPTKRSWFVRALEYPGRVVITAPYLDMGGAGYIVTLSHTIYEGKPAALHSSSDNVMAVMGIDFTLSYFYKLLLEFMPSCKKDRMVCFLLDDKGYLIAHPGLIEPNGKGPVEQQHITHKEPLVANDILNHKGFVTKNVCNSYGDRTIQRYYQFNSSLDKVLSNYVHGEHCSRYQIMSLPGTNVFLGIVNQTCELVTAFCPCSMVDRLCLNCNRMEQSECECPCECPLEMNLCTGKLSKEDDINPSCPHFPEESRILDMDSANVDSLSPCFDSNCPNRKLEGDCFGVIDCEWCQLDSDGLTAFKNPFCTQQRKCFGGVLGARTPYADEIVDSLPREEFLNIKSTPVGPVAGGIMGFFLVLVLVIYCYRQRLHRSAGQYINAPGSNIQMSHLNEADDIEPYEAYPGGNSNALATFENPVNVSPYQMNTNYRRPPGGDSDHGYSTMTPHEDSEYTSSCVEPLMVGKDRLRTASPMALTSNSRASSPVPLPNIRPDMSSTHVRHTLDLSQTVIPEARHGHHILAPVQVHMVDTQ